jgi:hypothetical protein
MAKVNEGDRVLSERSNHGRRTFLQGVEDGTKAANVPMMGIRDRAMKGGLAECFR